MSKKNIFRLILSDLKAARHRDPAANSYLEIILTYSSFHAVIAYRLSHFLWKIKLKLIARFVSNIFRIITSIEIHPGARIDESFFIDHGAGLVIGETALLGKNITMYQQVTLGGISPSINSKNQAKTKRHPTLKDGVIVGSGAQILGPISIGKNARIGSNAVVLKDVPDNETFIGVPARKVNKVNVPGNFNPYGIVEGKIDDPNKKSIIALLNEFYELERKISSIESDIDYLAKKRSDLENIIISKSSREKKLR